MAGLKSISMVLVLATILVAIAPRGEAAIGCGQVVSYLSPCIPYVTGRSPGLGGCCGGVKGLYGAAKTTPDRRAVCGCLKSLASAYGGPAISKASGLPGKCGVSIPYKISPSTNCNSIK